LKEEQIDPLLSSLNENERESLWILRSDNPISSPSAPCSISECITNLIATLYFSLRDYAIVSDIGTGPDLVPFKLRDLSTLRENSVFDKGLVELIRLNKWRKNESTNNSNSSPSFVSNKDEEPEVLAIETESWNPSAGIAQLKAKFVDTWFESHGFTASKPFDRAILAAPCFDQTLEDIDVLTYDKHGIKLNQSSKENYAAKVRQNKDAALSYFGRRIKRELLNFVRFKSVAQFSTLSDLPMFELDEGISNFIDSVELQRLIELYDEGSSNPKL
jgi:hypothetical protein